MKMYTRGPLPPPIPEHLPTVANLSNRGGHPYIRVVANLDNA